MPAAFPILLPIALIVATVPAAAEPEASARPAANAVRFNRDVRPILSDVCFTCHGPDAAARTTEMRLDTREGLYDDLGEYRAVVPGNLGESELWRRLSSDDPDVVMPPPDSGRKLTARQKATFERWIEQGAPYEGHWSFTPPVRPPLPQFSNRSWPRNGIDHFVLHRLDESGLAPSKEASKETLIRRVTLGLIGLPPTLDEVKAFLADDSPDAYERLVDRLLASPRYGERMALPWLDAARYADSNGYQQDRTRTAWPWRDWVVRSLNANRPFDELTIEQLAGDLLPDATLDQQLASGFNRNHMLNGEGGRIAEESRVEYVVDRVETTSTVWMGLTLGCARCHDHKYDPFSQREFYELYAFFNSIDESGRVDRGGDAAPVMPYPRDEDLRRIAAIEAEIDRLQHSLDNPQPVGKLALQRWEAQQRKRIVEVRDVNSWTLLLPESFTSKEGQDLGLLDDWSILAGGHNPETDVYTIRAKPELPELTGLRLEAIPDESLTYGGLARSDSGNFVLSGVELALRTKDGKTTPLKLAGALADHEQGGFPVAHTIDGKDSTGWAVLSLKIDQPRTAVFVLEKPARIPDGAELVVTLKHEVGRHAHHILGRFRLAVTGNDEIDLDAAVLPPPLPDDVAAILSTPAGERTDAQRDRLLAYHTATSQRTNQLRDRIVEQRGKLAEVKKGFPQVMVMRELEHPRTTNLLVRGAWDQYGEEVQRSLPAVLTSATPSRDDEGEDEPLTRLDLARWLVAPEHPLTARVTVNRYWQHFLGHGLVRTPEDFGSQGERPTHPELLDWLATEFVRTGWDVKRMHRLIVTSATYRQSSEVTPELVETDDENRLLARGPRHRLSSAALRDQALSLAGLLVERVGGEPVFPYQPDRIWEDFSFDKIKYVQDHGPDLYRRSLYTFWRRSVGPTMLFDTSSRQVCTVDVRRTNTPLHALTTLNDTTYVEAARKFAERTIVEGGETDEKRATWAFQLATSRPPSPHELAILLRAHARATEYYAAHPDEATELLGVGESPVAEPLDPAKVAAWTGVASVILNLDEVLVSE